MLRAVSVISVTLAVALISGCDGYTYKGMDAKQALARANTMSLPAAYSFYLETYRGVHPPMLDVAETFSRFGGEGSAYLSQKALDTTDRTELEADLHALLILDFRCPDQLTKALQRKSGQMGASISGNLACGVRA